MENKKILSKEELLSSRLAREHFFKKVYKSNEEFIKVIFEEYLRWISYDKEIYDIDSSHLKFLRELYGNKRGLNVYMNKINPLISSWKKSVKEEMINIKTPPSVRISSLLELIKNEHEQKK